MGVTVRQKQPGKGNPWWIFIHHQGKRKAKMVGDKKKAEKAAAEIRRKLKHDEQASGSKERSPLFKDYALTWLDTQAKAFLKPSTMHDYRLILKNQLNPVFGSIPINQIKRNDVKKFICEKLSLDLLPKTVYNFKVCLSSILTGAVDDELIPINPARQLGKQVGRMFKKKEGESTKVDPFTREEGRHFLETAKDFCPRYYPLFFVALRTGMRLGEIIGLTPDDLDFKKRRIRVERAIVMGDVTTTKSGKVRYVDMSEQLALVLHAWLIVRAEEKLSKGWKKEWPRWLFYNKYGCTVDPANLRNRYFYPCLKKAGLRRIRFHDLRHTFATLLIAQGESLAYVRDQMGHHSIQITVDIYGHLVPGSNKSAVDKLDDGDATGRNQTATRPTLSRKKGPTKLASP